jgi:hypothetical protein
MVVWLVCQTNKVSDPWWVYTTPVSAALMFPPFSPPAALPPSPKQVDASHVGIGAKLGDYQGNVPGEGQLQILISYVWFACAWLGYVPGEGPFAACPTCEQVAVTVPV